MMVNYNAEQRIRHSSLVYKKKKEEGILLLIWSAFENIVQRPGVSVTSQKRKKVSSL